VNMRDIALHIDELVLHGFKHGDRYLIAEAITQELHRLIAEQGLLPALNSDKEMASINAGVVQLTAQNRPDDVGILIAGALYKGMSV
jgi:hypothetical protein